MGSSWELDPSAGWRGGQAQALAVAAAVSSRNESAPLPPPAPSGLREAAPRLSVRPGRERP